MLGLAVRSVQLMVDRGELQAWKTPGGHRRIVRASVERWEAKRQAALEGTGAAATVRASPRRTRRKHPPRVLLIEDSRHFRTLISMIVRQHFPTIEMRDAEDGIMGLTLVGALHPDVLLVDILLPGIDGVTLITGLRSHPEFADMTLAVVTSLEPPDLEPYAYALQGIPVVSKSRLAVELPALLSETLGLPQEAPPKVARPAPGPDAAASPTLPVGRQDEP